VATVQVEVRVAMLSNNAHHQLRERIHVRDLINTSQKSRGSTKLQRSNLEEEIGESALLHVEREDVACVVDANNAIRHILRTCNKAGGYREKD